MRTLVSIADQVDQFLYQYPLPQYKTQLMNMIRQAEETYIRRIAELEQTALPNKAPALLDRTEYNYNKAESCYCAVSKMPPCSWCTDPKNDPDLIELEDDDDGERRW